VDNIIGATFGLISSLLLAGVHLAAFRSPRATATARMVDRWYSRWWTSENERHGMLGFMCASCLFMALFFVGALIWEISGA